MNKISKKATVLIGVSTLFTLSSAILLFNRANAVVSQDMMQEMSRYCNSFYDSEDPQENCTRANTELGGGCYWNGTTCIEVGCNETTKPNEDIYDLGMDLCPSGNIIGEGQGCKTERKKVNSSNLGRCEYTCKEGTHFNSNRKCIDNVCKNSNPTNSVRNNSKVPSNDNQEWAYADSGSTIPCTFHCADGYTWNGEICTVQNGFGKVFFRRKAGHDKLPDRQLTKGSWDDLMDKLDEISQRLMPQGAVVAFNRTSCPEGWKEFTSANGRFILGRGNGYSLRQQDGHSSITLTKNQMPSHYHYMIGNEQVGDSWFRDNPALYKDMYLAERGNSSNGDNNDQYDLAATSQYPIFARTSSEGGGGSINIMNPYIALLYCEKI